MVGRALQFNSTMRTTCVPTPRIHPTFEFIDRRDDVHVNYGFATSGYVSNFL